MALTKLNAEMDHISRLSDMPQQEGIGTAELKARFDAGNRQIKEYLNAVLLPELDNELARMREQLRMLSLPQDICYRVKRGTALLGAGGWLPDADGALYRQSVADIAIGAEMTVLLQVAAADLAAGSLGAYRADAYDGGFSVSVAEKPLADVNIDYTVLDVG
ncbi:MAG: hypothetical protein IJF62_00790 [Firmicutes bacterium]|nr:hypothetical protein [Bacillota bacterium]